VVKKIFILFLLFSISFLTCCGTRYASAVDGYYYRFNDYYLDDEGNVMTFDTPYGKISKFKNGPISIKKGNGYIFSDYPYLECYTLNGNKFKSTKLLLEPCYNDFKEIIYYEDMYIDQKLGYKKKYDLNYNVIHDYDNCFIKKDLNGNCLMYDGFNDKYKAVIVGENLTKMIDEVIVNRYFDDMYVHGYDELIDNMTSDEYFIIGNGKDTIVYNDNYNEVIRVGYMCREYVISNNRIVFTDLSNQINVYNINTKSFKEYDVSVIWFYDDKTYLDKDRYFYQDNIKTNLRCDYDPFIEDISFGGSLFRFGRYMDSIYLNDDSYLYRYRLNGFDIVDSILLDNDIYIDLLNDKLITNDFDGKNHVKENNTLYIKLDSVYSVSNHGFNYYITRSTEILNSRDVYISNGSSYIDAEISDYSLFLKYFSLYQDKKQMIFNFNYEEVILTSDCIVLNPSRLDVYEYGNKDIIGKVLGDFIYFINDCNEIIHKVDVSDYADGKVFVCLGE